MSFQVQVNLQSGIKQPQFEDSMREENNDEDDIDAALADLQVTLEGSHISRGPNNIINVPELSGYMRFLK